MQEASEFGERCDMNIDCLSDERHANRRKCTLPREGAQSIDADVVFGATGALVNKLRIGDAGPCAIGTEQADSPRYSTPS